MSTSLSATASATSGKARVVIWFKNDLRLHDNEVVDRARSLVASGAATEVLPLYCFDPRSFIMTPWGNPKTGALRAQFLLESVLDLKSNLCSIGSDLLIKLGRPEEVLSELVGVGGAKQDKVLSQEEFTFEELQVMSKVRRALKGKATVEESWEATMLHLHDLPFAEDLQDLPDVFTPFRNKVENRVKPRPLKRTPAKGDLPLPQSLESLEYQPKSVEDLNEILPEDAPKFVTPKPHPKAALRFKGGESEALRRLKYYLWDSDLVATYFETRNGMLGGDYSTKLSPWLANGNLSPRIIEAEIRKYESQRTGNKSTYWVIFEMLWRDYFRFFTLKHGNSIFFEGGTIGKKVEWVYDENLFLRWREGRTGMPLVDANMRELRDTGFMSNRGRQNVASYLVLDLGLDWRQGADWFESVLLDYDVASNWGNWVSAAGLTGGRLNRFNITKQSKDYDLHGEYIRTWLPELAKVPEHKIHEPWTMTPQEQEAAGVHIGKDYPQPPKSRFVPQSRESRYGGGRGRGGGSGNRGRGSSGGRGQRFSRGQKGQKGSEFDRYG